MKKRNFKRRYIYSRILLVVADLICVFAAALVSYWLVNWQVNSGIILNWEVACWAIVNAIASIGVIYVFGLYTMPLSSVGITEAIRIMACAACIGVSNFIFVFVGDLIGDMLRYGLHLGYIVMAVYTLLIFAGLLGLRFLKRGYQSLATQFSSVYTRRKKVMIIGFNNDAFTLIRTMITDKKNPYKPVCLLDDDESLHGKEIYDIRVVGSTYEVKALAKRFGVQEIFVAVPSTDRANQRKILERCAESGCTIKMLPELNQMAHGELSVSKLRNVEVEDLLGRAPKSVNLNEVMGYIEGKVVMVTGGGGSIGSELCRQIASHNPKQLIILDIYENNAYEIEQELKRAHSELNLLTLIASIRDQGKMRDVFMKHRPQIVFNAAAHKHVPLMETSPNEAVKNNVFGTLNVARAANEFGVETFVQISTDKAVNPTNIMGATKRICEMIIQTLGRHSQNTNFVAVRFGNVLGSNGSVIPLFKKQIEEGGPVTVTHKDIIRYFMTIPEAVSLVLQAGAYAKNGQIFVLDMGEPVKIYDLAYNLIKLSGLEPDVDIEIKCTGLRPGEKLFEERLMAEEGLQKTPNGLINIARPIPLDEENFWQSLDELYEAAYSETDKMKDWVKLLVPTYTIDKGENTAKEDLREDQEKLGRLLESLKDNSAATAS